MALQHEVQVIIRMIFHQMTHSTQCTIHHVRDIWCWNLNHCYLISAIDCCEFTYLSIGDILWQNNNIFPRSDVDLMSEAFICITYCLLNDSFEKRLCLISTIHTSWLCELPPAERGEDMNLWSVPRTMFLFRMLNKFDLKSSENVRVMWTRYSEKVFLRVESFVTRDTSGECFASYFYS